MICEVTEKRKAQKSHTYSEERTLYMYLKLRLLVQTNHHEDACNVIGDNIQLN